MDAEKLIARLQGQIAKYGNLEVLIDGQPILDHLVSTDKDGNRASFLSTTEAE